MATRGRPRSFDTEEALDKAIDVFWRQGYENTTVEDLATAMCINKPSLYAAFGKKEHLFHLAMARYAAIDMAYVEDALAEATARDMAEHYLRSNVIAITTPGKPPGCLSIQGGLAGSDESRDVIEFLNESRAAGEKRLAERLARAIADGDLDSEENPQDLAKYLSTVSAGLAVQAASGAARDELDRVASRALRAFDAAEVQEPS